MYFICEIRGKKMFVILASETQRAAEHSFAKRIICVHLFLFFLICDICAICV